MSDLVIDSCAATIRVKARLYICDLPFGHEGDHAQVGTEVHWNDAGDFTLLG